MILTKMAAPGGELRAGSQELVSLCASGEASSSSDAHEPAWTESRADKVPEELAVEEGQDGGPADVCGREERRSVSGLEVGEGGGRAGRTEGRGEGKQAGPVVPDQSAHGEQANVRSMVEARSEMWRSLLDRRAGEGALASGWRTWMLTAQVMSALPSLLEVSALRPARSAAERARRRRPGGGSGARSRLADRSSSCWTPTRSPAALYCKARTGRARADQGRSHKGTLGARARRCPSSGAGCALHSYAVPQSMSASRSYTGLGEGTAGNEAVESGRGGFEAEQRERGRERGQALGL